MASGLARMQPRVPQISDITKTPRKYGFLGNLKPAFKLSEQQRLEDLQHSLEQFANQMTTVVCSELKYTILRDYIALAAQGNNEAIGNLAAKCVIEFDRFRANATDADLTLDWASGLTARQKNMVADWGNPFVLDEFRFHLPLTNPLPAETWTYWTEVLKEHLPELPQPLLIDSISLIGERANGYFELIENFRLGVDGKR